MKNMRHIFAVGVIVIAYIILLFVSYSNYENARQIIKSEYGAKHKLVEESVYNTIKYADTMLEITEKQLNVELKDKSQILIDKYANESDVMAWNMQQLKSQIGDYDIYIINEDFKVIRTTFKEDLGLDFKKFPTFSQLLTSRLQGDSFVSDRMDISTNTGKLMKYSYVPTPDHKYLLELSVDIEERFPVMNDLDIFSVAQQLTLKYPSVENILIYKTHFKRNAILQISKDKPYYSVVTGDKTAHIQTALKSDEVLVNNVKDQASGNSFTHKYIPYVANTSDGEYSWWNSYVIEVVYNNMVFEELGHQKMVFWKSIALISLVYLTLALVILYLLIKSEHMAYHDPLTNLPNRKLFEWHINQAIMGAKRSNLELAILFLDLDNFKDINDTYGHGVGDKVLKQVSERLTSNLRKSDVVSRLGGDEFTILLSDIKCEDNVAEVANKISSLFNAPVKVGTQEFYLRFSIGISCYPKDGEKSESLMKKADMAMYQAKNEQLDYVIYTKA